VGPVRVTIFEDHGWTRLLPLVYTRPAFLLVCGMDTLWETASRIVPGGQANAWVRPSLAASVRERIPARVNEPAAGATLFVNGRGRWRRLPPTDGTDWVGTTADGQVACVAASGRLAEALSPEVLLDEARASSALAGLPTRDVSDCAQLFDWPWQLVHANAAAIVDGWAARGSAAAVNGTVDAGVHLLNPSAIHVGEGARIKPCVVVDAENGPVWIGNNVRVQPHCYIEGPAYVGDGTLLQPGAVVRGGASIGPVCKVGGEIEGSVILGYSNKQHDGFLGHSYVGSFVNIAADCINSDLKNTYGTVRVPINGREVDSGERFVGLTVGDHAKAGINVSFPTGAVMGFCSSVVGSQCPKFVPSFAWIEDGNWERYDAARGLAIAKRVMARRSLVMSTADEAVFLAVRRQALALEHASQLRIE